MKVLDKLRRGVVELAAGDECRYAEPSFLQRAYLIWTFRNFRRLSVRILNQTQLKMVECLSQTAYGAANKKTNPAPVIGRAEFAAFPPRKLLIVESAPPGAMMQHVLSRMRSLNSVHRLGKLPRVIAHHAAEAAANSARAMRKPARYSLTLALAAASLVALSGALAQRLWIKHREPLPVSQPLSPDTSEQAHTATGIQSAAAAATSPARETVPGNAISPAALQVHPAISSPDKGKAIRPTSVLGDAAIADAAADTSSRLRVFLAPRRVIYPSIPDSGLSGNEKKQIFVKAIVNGEGMVDDVQVPGQASVLATAIAKTVRQWRYEPYMRNGQAVEVETHMIFTVLGPDAITVRFLPANENAANN